MGACATKPGDLKVKGEAPLVVEDAAAPALAAADEKAKAGVLPPVAAAAAEVDQADVSRRRSLSDLLKRDAEASDSDREADHQEAEKLVTAAEPASAAGETMGSPQAPVQPSVEIEQAQAPVEPSVAIDQDDTAEELKHDPSGDAQAQAAEEEKRVDPESVQVAAAAAAPSSEESKVADDDAAASA